MNTIRQVLLVVLFAAGLCCACHAANCEGQDADCQGEDGCATCVVCQASLIVQEQPDLYMIRVVRFVPPVSDLPLPSSFVDVPLQPPRV